MLKTANKKFIPLAAAIALVLGTGSAMAGSGYATDSLKEVVMSGAGECWNSVDGPQMPPVEKCGDSVAPKEEQAAATDGDDDRDGVLNSEDRCPNTEAGATVDSDGCQIVENLTINLVVDEFDFDSAVLKPEMKAALEDLAERIKESPGHEKLTIIGHTDSTGPAAYNQKLSERRAEAAAEYLRSLGIDEIATEGRGESEPIADNSTREGRAKNRRIEIHTH